MDKPIRYRKHRKTRVLRFNPWNFDAEPGDLMVANGVQLFRLEEARTPSVSAVGELYPRVIKPPHPGMRPWLVDDEVWWYPPGDCPKPIKRD